MQEEMAVVLVPGLLCTPRLYLEQLPALWRFGPVVVADHTRDDGMSAIAGRILANAPPRFALIGLSMGGYIAFELWRQAPQRIVKLALLDTTARPDLPEHTEQRKLQIGMARSGRFAELSALLFPKLVSKQRQEDRALRAIVEAMASDIGPEAFVRQQTAIMHRVDSRPDLPTIRCPTLVVVGEQDTLTPPERAVEMTSSIQSARQIVVPDCGHLSTLEQPQTLGRVLTEFLGSTS